MIPRALTRELLQERLEALLCEEPEGQVVFDADGTLWSHDVGAMVFDWTCSQSSFRDEARDALTLESMRLGLRTSPGSTVNDLARALQTFWYDGSYDERAAAEMQVWAYIGFSRAEFSALVRDALADGGHEETLHHEVIGLAKWLAERGTPPLIVSASPLWVLEEATSTLPFFSIDRIAGGVPNTIEHEGSTRIAALLESPLPYGPDKVDAGKNLLRGRPWLATFGDSHFDLEMMREARLAIGIGEKTDMLVGLAKLEGSTRLSF